MDLFSIIIILIGIYLAFYLAATSFDFFTNQSKKVQENLNNLKNLKSELDRQENIINTGYSDIKELSLELSKGFPLLAKAYNEYFKLIDGRLEYYLHNKKNPAHKAADMVKEISAERRKALKRSKILEYLVEYYETMAPFLLDVKDEVIADLEGREILQDYSEEEQQDRVTQYVTKEEYRKMTVTERNQLALDRYWERRKSKLGIGILYERYVGYLYEQEGYEVEYTGIVDNIEDLGRDLIAKKGKEVIVVQCKNWSQFKTIYENHIFQFFGTTFKYRQENKGKNIVAKFYTTTTLSPVASLFAKELGIELFENFKLIRYPCIKCNIARGDDVKIYHLPFDQQYDTTRIEPSKGEFYAMTTTEAESKGFRRAWRWSGNK